MRNHLAELINKNLKGRSYRQLSRDCGGEPSPSGLSKLMSTPVNRLPTHATLIGLSRGLNVGVREIVLASCETMGLKMNEDNDLRINRGKLLPEPSQQAILNVAREMLAWHDGTYATDETVTKPPFLRMAADQGEQKMTGEEISEY